MAKAEAHCRAERLFVVKLRQAKFSRSVVHSMTGHAPKYQNRWIARYQATGDVYDEPRAGRPVTVLTPMMKLKLERMIRDRAAASPRKTVKKLRSKGQRISRTSIQRFLKTQPWGTPFKRKYKCYIDQSQRRARLTWAKANKKKGMAHWKRMIFSDEKRFHLNPRLNHQNDRVYTSDPESIPAKELKQADSFWMVWGAVSYTGRTDLHFLPQKQTVTGAYYREKIIRKVLMPALMKNGKLAESSSARGRLIFQQDKATAHTAMGTQRLLREELPCSFLDKNSWAAKLVDINIMEKVWGIMDTKMLDEKFTTMAQLRRVVTKVWNHVSQGSIQSLYKSVPSRVKAIISCGGNIPPEAKNKNRQQ